MIEYRFCKLKDYEDMSALNIRIHIYFYYILANTHIGLAYKYRKAIEQHNL